MTRLLRRFALSGVLSCALLVGGVASAQSFEGLDLGGETHHHRRHHRRHHRHHRRRRKKKAQKKSPAEATAPATGQTAAPSTTPPVSSSTEKSAAQATAPSAGQSTTPSSSPSATPSPAGQSGGLGLNLSGSGTQAGAAASSGKTAAPNASAGTGLALDLTGKPEAKHALDAAIAQFKADKYEEAALDAWALMKDPKDLPVAVDAQYVVAKSLYRMGLYHSSLGEFSQILAKGPGTKYFDLGLEWLFFISHKTVNESVILDEIARYSNFEFPKRFRDEFHYLLARYYFVRGRALDQIGRKPLADESFSHVKSLVALIPKTTPFFVKGQYLTALTEFRNARYQTSLDTFKDVVHLTHPGRSTALKDPGANLDLRELSIMQLARIHYGHRQNRYALYYYSKIQRGDPQWLEALFEGAWASYRLGHYEQALGNLITLDSPFFRDEYFPEAMILEAVIYYENCRYREANAIVTQFEHTYGPVHQELDALLAEKMPSSGYYDVLAAIQRKQKKGVELTRTDRILARILKLALTDKSLKATNDSILELENEVDAIGQRSDTFKYSDLAKHLLAELKTQREGLVQKAGVMTESKLQHEAGNLRELLSNGLRIRYQISTQEKGFLQAQLRDGAKRAIVKDYKYSVAVADDELYWPFQGEYWRDELGTYQYTLTKGCANPNSAVTASNDGVP